MRIETKDIIRIAKDLDIAINNNEKFAVPILAARATKGALKNPGDETLRMISNVLSKMSENGTLFISKGSFNEIYNKFATRNSKANEYFADELNKTDDELEDRELAGKEDSEIGLYEGADKTVSNALDSLWDDNGNITKTAEYKSYNPKVAEKANYITNLQFAKLGVNAKEVKTFAGTDKFILCDAVCETPNGDSHILVPVEISVSGVLIPVMFINKHGFVDLNENTLEKHFNEFAGKNLNVNSEKIFELLHTASNIDTIDEFGLQVLAVQNAVKQGCKLNTSVGDLVSVVAPEDFAESATTGDYSGYNGLLDKLRQASEPKASKEDINLFGSYLETAKGIAELNFSKSTVENGRNVIASKIASFGYRPQITVTACDYNSITYAVAIATKNGPLGFEVISEVENEKPLVPYIMAVSDKVYDFTVQGLETAINDKVNNNKVLAVVSPLYDLKSSEIVAIIKQAAGKGDYQTAEEALNVLSEKADFTSYAIALNEYIKGVNGDITKEACKSSECKCTRIIKASNRGKPLCGHLNLPLDQVSQDKNGNCIPKYRENMNDTYEGMLFNTSKIFQ